MKKILYFCSSPRNWGPMMGSVEKSQGHNKISVNDISIYWPESLTPLSVNPTYIESLFSKKQIQIVVLDRVKNSEGLFPIEDHINKSGYSFLSGKTPHNNRPRFPDISNAYTHPSPNPNGKTVVTIGPKRFSDSNLDGAIISEAAGLVVPVLNYVGLKCAVWGGEPPIEISELITLTNIQVQN